MTYPFLEHNRLVIIDYMPGSSGQLLMRLWQELDSTIEYDNPNILKDIALSDHPASREIDVDVGIPKTLFNWYVDRCEPRDLHDHLRFWDLMSTMLVSMSQKWKHGDPESDFYRNQGYALRGHTAVYGIHSRRYQLPVDDMTSACGNLSIIRLVPETDEGLYFQKTRYAACYPEHVDSELSLRLCDWNGKTWGLRFDLCTLLMRRDSDTIISWLRQQIGDGFDDNKIDRVKSILSLYYEQVVAYV